MQRSCFLSASALMISLIKKNKNKTTLEVLTQLKVQKARITRHEVTPSARPSLDAFVYIRYIFSEYISLFLTLHRLKQVHRLTCIWYDLLPGDEMCPCA